MISPSESADSKQNPTKKRKQHIAKYVLYCSVETNNCPPAERAKTKKQRLHQVKKIW
jgi:hypothetical protein